MGRCSGRQWPRCTIRYATLTMNNTIIGNNWNDATSYCSACYVISCNHSIPDSTAAPLSVATPPHWNEVKTGLPSKSIYTTLKRFRTVSVRFLCKLSTFCYCEAYECLSVLTANHGRYLLVCGTKWLGKRANSLSQQGTRWRRTGLPSCCSAPVFCILKSVSNEVWLLWA